MEDSVGDDHRANRIGVEPTTAEAKGSKPNTFTYFATHNWAQLGKIDAVEGHVYGLK